MRYSVQFESPLPDNRALRTADPMQLHERNVTNLVKASYEAQEFYLNPLWLTIGHLEHMQLQAAAVPNCGWIKKSRVLKQ